MTAKTTAIVRRNLQLMDNNNNNNYMKNESHVEYNHIVVVYAFELYYIRYYTAVAYRMSSYFLHVYTILLYYMHIPTLYSIHVRRRLNIIQIKRVERETSSKQERYKIRSTINWTE